MDRDRPVRDREHLSQHLRIWLAVPRATTLLGSPPGDYELTLRQGGTTDVVAGPQLLTLTGGGIFGVLVTNGATATTANIVLLDDF